MFGDAATGRIPSVSPPTAFPTAPKRTRSRRTTAGPPTGRSRTLSLSLLIFFMLSFLISSPSAGTAGSAGAASATRYEQLAGVLDTRTQFSDGIYSIDGLAKMAEERSVQVLFINDHDKLALSYGLPPFPNLINKTVELNSILKGKPVDYLQAVSQAQERYKHIIIIPGSESAPFYYWTGNPFRKNLTAHDHERRILTVGLAKADDYRRLPVIHNTGPFNMDLLPGVAPFIIALFLAAVMILWRGWMRIAGIALAVVALLYIVDNHPFRATVFDPFHGDQGARPYQRLIDYVSSRDGLTFWNYPETRSGVRRLGPIHVSTKPYPEMLLATQGYTGFSALYGDNITITEPGNIWDAALKEHCRGYRHRPPWGVGTADYHKEGESGEKFGNYQTVFLVREKTGAAVLQAMRNGRMYARQGNFPKLPRLDEFTVSDAAGEQRGEMGDTIKMGGNPHIHIRISAAPPATPEPSARPGTPVPPESSTSPAPQESSIPPGTPSPQGTPAVKVRLIRNGSLIAEANGPLPLTFNYEDKYYQPGENIYYRMDMEGMGKIVANPIFVAFTGAKP